jgi:hypothetical protein
MSFERARPAQTVPDRPSQPNDLVVSAIAINVASRSG